MTPNHPPNQRHPPNQLDRQSPTRSDTSNETTACQRQQAVRLRASRPSRQTRRCDSRNSATIASVKRDRRDARKPGDAYATKRSPRPPVLAGNEQAPARWRRRRALCIARRAQASRGGTDVIAMDENERSRGRPAGLCSAPASESVPAELKTPVGRPVRKRGRRHARFPQSAALPHWHRNGRHRATQYLVRCRTACQWVGAHAAGRATGSVGVPRA
jgi:hypothetical protein